MTVWKELWIVTWKHMHRLAPERYAAAFTAPEFEGRRRRYVAASAEGMRAPVPIPGGFLETNLSATHIMRLVRDLLVFCGVDLGTVAWEAEPPVEEPVEG